MSLGDGCFVRFERGEALAVVLWGEGIGAWRLDAERESPVWQATRVWLDLGGLNLGPLFAPRPHRAPERVRCWRQTMLPFERDEYAQAWNDRARALGEALSAVPAWASAQVARLGPRQQWALLRFISRSGEAGAELCQSNLALAYIAATHWLPERPSELVRKRQRSLLGCVQRGATRSMVRVLRRVEDEAIDEALLANLFRWMNDEDALGRLAHSPRIGPALRHLPRPGGPEWMEPRAVREALVTLDRDDILALARAERTVRALERADLSPGRRLRSLSDLPDFEAGLLERLRFVRPGESRLTFPTPPNGGIAGAIEPIGSLGALYEEAESMAHCAATYAERALDGELVFYRVLEPQRATLAIAPNGRGWRVFDLKCRANRLPASGTVAAVGRWLQSWAGRRRRRRADENQLGLW